MERYHMPVAVEVEGAAGKGKLDKKVVEVEEDISQFYLNSRANWKEHIADSPNRAGYSDIYFKYDYHSAY
jgi:hypothetical protein